MRGANLVDDELESCGCVSCGHHGIEYWEEGSCLREGPPNHAPLHSCCYTCIQFLSCGQAWLCLAGPALGWFYCVGSVERAALARISDSLLLLKRAGARWAKCPFGSRDMLFVMSRTMDPSEICTKRVERLLEPHESPLGRRGRFILVTFSD